MTPLSEQELGLVDAYWRAANHLSVAQISLLDNPLLREPLRPEHVKPRLLGHFGTVPGLNLLYAHLNRQIGENRADVRAAVAGRLRHLGEFRVVAVPAREELVIARAVRGLLARGE